MEFKADPITWLTGPQYDAAVEHLATYMTTYTGRYFERFASLSDENRFEASDLVAVSCLSVDVPAPVSAWLLLGDGQGQTAKLLRQIGIGFNDSLWDHDLPGNPALEKLWTLLRAQRDMGPTTVSKLLAVKRPHLIPIYDSYVAAALIPEDVGTRLQWWQPWWKRFRANDHDEFKAAVASVRDAVAARGIDVDGLSDLRVIDIVIWRSEQQRRREQLG